MYVSSRRQLTRSFEKSSRQRSTPIQKPSRRILHRARNVLETISPRIRPLVLPPQRLLHQPHPQIRQSTLPLWTPPPKETITIANMNLPVVPSPPTPTYRSTRQPVQNGSLNWMLPPRVSTSSSNFPIIRESHSGAIQLCQLF